jgi:prepilin signal peptidase PulO-like enzyme (type II secretory pathway)
MAMSGEQQGVSSAQAAGWLRFLVDSWAVSVVIFLRSGFGVRYSGSQGAMVLLIVPMFLFLTPPAHDPRPLCWFLGAYLVMWVFARLGALRRRATGDTTHSYYSGWPRLMAIFRFLSESTVKQYVEPVLVALLGAWIGNYNAPLGIYLVVAAVCMAVASLQDELALRRRVMEMNDAVSEQRVIAEQFREMQGDNF